MNDDDECFPADFVNRLFDMITIADYRLLDICKI
jgi:hypothetical protein